MLGGYIGGFILFIFAVFRVEFARDLTLYDSKV